LKKAAKSKISIRYTPAQVAEMVSLAWKLGSARKAGKMLGVRHQTVLEKCHAAGMTFVTAKQKSGRLPSIVVDGFRFTKTKGYYRGKTDHGREALSQYLYRKIYGTEKPGGICIHFKDGKSDNYALENIEFITVSERMRIEEAKRHDENVRNLDRGRLKVIEMEKREPHRKQLRVHRQWVTRRKNDPDNLFAMKVVESRRKHAEERGFFYTEEQRRHMSDARKGKSKKELETIKNENYKASIRRKMGIAV